MKIARKILIALAISLLCFCFLCLVFPIISNIIGTQIANSAIADFDKQLENIYDGSYEEALQSNIIDEDGYLMDGNKDVPLLFKVDLDRLYADSVSYNDNLKNNQYNLLTNSSSYTNPSLNLQSYGIHNGMYAYISAPAINMKLPIYLGANDTTMSYGIAHLTYTSLPIGGNKTNTVLAGHTGYIGMIFFDNIRNLQIGDTIIVKNYWDTLNYKVTKTTIAKPNEIQDIYIKGNNDLLTLITCINGGSDRFIVICERS